jgi:phosphohistidine swiveling domain-containing protein
MTAPLLKTLDEIEGGDLPLVGAKAFNLATLRRHSLPVLPGLVVTTAFFKMQLQHRQFIPLWAGSPDVAVTAGALGWLADTLKTSPLARDLLGVLRDRLAETFPHVETFAVRSSAIDEDASQHAFSGIHLTELGVPREMIPISLGRCWGSALSRPALEYRRQHGIPIQSIQLAVIIQPFIQPTAGGVAFTVNPLTGAHDEIVIEAAFGHGGAIAEGRITPARYRLTKRPPDYPVIDWAPGDVPRQPHDATFVSDGRGPLSASDLRALAQYLEQIEALMAAPQDVEWAIMRKEPGADAELLFFQTRPITAVPSGAASLDVEWTRANYREFLPDLPSPMCTSLLERTRDHALSLFKHLGFNLEDIGPYLKTIYGRPYLNLTLARRLLGQSGLDPLGILWIIGHTELPGNVRPTYSINWRQTWAARGPVARSLLRSLRAGAEVHHFERLADEVRHLLDATNWAEALPTDLLTRFRLRTQLSSQMTRADFGLSAATIVLFAIIASALRPLSQDVGQLIREVINISLQAGDSRQRRTILELAEILRTDENAQRYLSSRRDRFDDHRQALAGTPFLAAFDSFIVQCGQLATFEADPGCPRYSEDPSPLLATVTQIASADTLSSAGEQSPGQSSEGSQDQDEPRWASLRPARTLRRTLSWRYLLVYPAIQRLRRLARLRVRLRALYGGSMSKCRLWDLKLAERWVALGWLVEPEDYFWLTMEEVERALVAENDVGPTLSALVRARRETYQTYAKTEMPYTLLESDIARLVPGRGLTGTALSSVLSGLPISPGQVQGQVVVLNQPEDSAHMKEGAILVTPSTDTAWFPIFPQARGLIVETGGLLSHGSIIAREFGLPAVADIPDATRRFQDGDWVLLDGSTGLVQILYPATDESPRGTPTE